MITKYFAATMIALIIPALALADSYDSRRYTQQANPSAPHAGQLDTDGILSPGEIRNPNIDYDRAQHQAERHDDFRVDNPINDQAAAEDRYKKDRERDYEESDREWRDRRDAERRQAERDRGHSWWPW
jgi:hypothetical protein